MLVILSIPYMCNVKKKKKESALRNSVFCGHAVLVTSLPSIFERMLEGRRDVTLFAVPSQLDAMGRSRHAGEPISFQSRSREKRESIRSYGRTWTRSFRSASRSLRIGAADVEESSIVVSARRALGTLVGKEFLRRCNVQTITEPVVAT